MTPLAQPCPSGRRVRARQRVPAVAALPALELVAVTGWAVLPLRGKVPLTPNGVYDATTEPASITAWWQRWPAANCGVRTGSGLLVLDADGNTGAVELEELERTHDALAGTPKAKTGGGGTHHYFKLDEPVRCSAGRLATNLDVRCEGGYVVAPPSVHPETGERYEWMIPPGDIALAPTPDWLMRALADGRRHPDARAARSKHAEHQMDRDVLRRIPASQYIPLLTGRTRVSGKVQCVFHTDRTPSLHAYDRPSQGWFCFGCEQGGSIIDFGAGLYGITPRGAGFHEIRRRLARDLLGRAS